MRSESIAPASPMPCPSEISEPSEAPTCPEAIGSSREVSPARIFPSLVRALGFKGLGLDCGTSTPELLASYDQNTQSWRTSALSLFGDWTAFSGAYGKKHPKRQTVCKICGEPARKLDMCQKHYQRFKKYGDPLLTKKKIGSGFELVREIHGAMNGQASPE